MRKEKLTEPTSLLLLAALTLSIPAFYLDLVGDEPGYRRAGSVLYLLAGLFMAAELGVLMLKGATLRNMRRHAPVDMAILAGALLSAWPAATPWSVTEWVLRLTFCGLVFFRLAVLGARFIAPNRVLHILLIAVVLLGVSGGGFYLLDPHVTTYQDGLWLSFTTAATVGFGDIVPSTPASRIFSVFIVLLGYAVFSVVTASIAALFVGEDEKRMQRELHADIRALRAEIADLKRQLGVEGMEEEGAVRPKEAGADQPS